MKPFKACSNCDKEGACKRAGKCMMKAEDKKASKRPVKAAVTFVLAVSGKKRK